MGIEEATDPAEPEVSENLQEPRELEPKDPQDEAPEQKPARKLKVANDEWELPETVDDDTYSKLEKTGKDLHGAWTRAMQTVAEERRVAQEEKQRQATEWAAAQEHLSDLAEAKAIKQQVDAYAKVDWQAWATQNADEANRHFMQYTTLQNQLAEKEKGIAAKKEEFTAKQQEAMHRARFDFNRVLSEKLPGWNGDKAKSLVDFGREYGFKPEEISATLDPRAVMVLHDAYLYRQSLKKATQPPSGPANPKPVAKVGGSAKASTGLSDDLSIEEWTKRREAQVRASNRR